MSWSGLAGSSSECRTDMDMVPATEAGAVIGTVIVSEASPLPLAVKKPTGKAWAGSQFLLP